MAKADGYPAMLRREFEELIDAMPLDDMQKRFLRSRWLDQVAWMEGKASEAQRHYYRLRLTTVIGAVVVPTLVGLETLAGWPGDAVKGATVVVSLVVAVCAAIEQFFHFGERWHHYRQTVERLKSEGWLFFQLTGPYAADGASHAAAYPSFAQRVEELLQSDVEAFVTEVAVEREQQPGRAG